MVPMTLLNTLIESIITEEENQNIAEDTVFVIEEIESMLREVRRMKATLGKVDISEEDEFEIHVALAEMEDALDTDDINILAETVDRQFRRYGDTFLRQYRCTSGPKKGRLVTSPEKCGTRKDPRKVRQGKRSARIKKGIRVRKTLFTKRKTPSKRLSRLNKILRGDHIKKGEDNSAASKSSSTTKLKTLNKNLGSPK